MSKERKAQFYGSSHYASFFINIPQQTISVKRWRTAFATIFSCRVLISVIASKKNNLVAGILRRDSSYTALEIVQESQEDDLQSTHLENLTKIVQEKSLDSLQQLGGVPGVAAALKTDRERGISGEPDDIRRRQEAFGSNSYERQPIKGFLRFVLEASKDLVIIILLVCAVLAIGFGIQQDGLKEGWYDGGSIFFAVFLVIAVTAVSNFRQARQFERLAVERSNIQIEAVRNGRRQPVSIFDIVVGDVVCLKIGDQIPADGLFLDGHSLQVDESSMTGESDHIGVDAAQNPFLISGTKVADGYATMLVTSVGMNTMWGKLMSTVSQDSNEQTPLQARLNKLTAFVGKVGLSVAVLVLIVLLVRYFTGNTKDKDGNREFYAGKTKFGDWMNGVVDIFAAAVTIVVVAIPEGLPLAVTLTLAYSMKRMMADHAMVRKLSACETMGSATVICTDKTGTLTMNQMTVTEFWVGHDKQANQRGPNSPTIAASLLKLLHQGVALNTMGSVYKSNSNSVPEFSGSPTEKAVLSWAVLELRLDMEELKRNSSILHVEAFNSEKKRSGVLMRELSGEDKAMHVHWKGAAEKILAICSHYYDTTGTLRSMSEQARQNLEQTIQKMATSSLRCIAFAHKKIKEGDGEGEDSKLEEGLELLALVGLKDPCRLGVKKAVEACKKAGVSIKMITGDNIFTARAIALECGIIEPGQDIDGAVVEGQEFQNYPPDSRMERVDTICVMARSSPFDKLLMVQCLRQKGHVVAVTGDGTNDAPALKEADIGLSMGIQGTEVAKESSDIVILDDNFASVATVLRWGRCVYNNIQKFIQFQLTVNVAALAINFVAAVSSGEVPLTAVQLLWVNLIMDTLGALALATERPTKELMQNPPVGRTEPLITNVMWRNLIFQAMYQIAVLLTLNFKGGDIFGVDKGVKDTIIFNTFVLCQIFNEFNARKLEKRNVFKGIHRNRLFLGIVGVTLVLQVVMVEFLKKFAGTERLNWGQWAACVGFAALAWPIAWLVKGIPVPSNPIFSSKID